MVRLFERVQHAIELKFAFCFVAYFTALALPQGIGPVKLVVMAAALACAVIGMWHRPDTCAFCPMQAPVEDHDGEVEANRKALEHFHYWLPGTCGWTVFFGVLTCVTYLCGGPVIAPLLLADAALLLTAIFFYRYAPVHMRLGRWCPQCSARRERRRHKQP